MWRASATRRMRGEWYLALVVLGCTLCAAQGDPQYALRTSVAEVPVTFSAIDRDGRTAQLSQADVAVLEDGKPRRIVAFRQTGEAPVEWRLLLDGSASVQKTYARGARMLADFVRRAVRPQDTVSVALFTATTKPMAFSDAQELEAKLLAGEPSGMTALYDAIERACWRRTGEDRRAALIVVSDGEDDLSRANVYEAIAAAQRANMPVYAISPDTSEEGKQALVKLTQQTGGRAFFGISKMAGALDAIEGEVRGQYELQYSTPPAADGRFHRIEVRTRVPGVRVHARAGYVAGESNTMAGMR